MKLTSAAQVRSMEVDVILDDLVNEVKAVVVTLLEVDRHIVTVLVEGARQRRHRECLHELVLRANVDVSGRERQGATLLVEDVGD